MEIFGIGPAEIVLILIIAFIVLGPERLPGAARTLGRWIRTLRSLSSETLDQVRTELADTTREVKEVRTELRALSGELTSQLKQVIEPGGAEQPAAAAPPGAEARQDGGEGEHVTPSSQPPSPL